MIRIQTMFHFGIHLSYWQTAWNDDLNPLIRRAQRAGFDLAEFPLLFPTRLDYSALRATLDELGMRASCSTGLGPETDITHPDPAVRQAGLAHLRACMQGAVRLGSPILAGVTYVAWGVFPQDDRPARRRQCIASLKEAADMAAGYGLTLCVEALNRFEGYLINTAAQGAALLDEVDRPNLKLQLDTFHMNIEEDHPGDAIRIAGSRLGHLHCVENNRKAPGQGHIDWDEVVQAVRAVDYHGYIVTETFANPAGEVGQGLFIWRPLAEDLDSAAAGAAAFLKGKFGNV